MKLSSSAVLQPSRSLSPLNVKRLPTFQLTAESHRTVEVWVCGGVEEGRAHLLPPDTLRQHPVSPVKTPRRHLNRFQHVQTAALILLFFPSLPRSFPGPSALHIMSTSKNNSERQIHFKWKNVSVGAAMWECLPRWVCAVFLIYLPLLLRISNFFFFFAGSSKFHDSTTEKMCHTILPSSPTLSALCVNSSSDWDVFLRTGSNSRPLCCSSVSSRLLDTVLPQIWKNKNKHLSAFRCSLFGQTTIWELQPFCVPLFQIIFKSI